MSSRKVRMDRPSKCACTRIFTVTVVVVAITVPMHSSQQMTIHPFSANESPSTRVNPYNARRVRATLFTQHTHILGGTFNLTRAGAAVVLCVTQSSRTDGVRRRDRDLTCRHGHGGTHAGSNGKGASSMWNA